MHKKRTLLLYITMILIGQITHCFAVDDTRFLSNTPKEIYGKATQNIGIRIGNGGAGPTGILRALAEDYIQQTHAKFAIAWYQDISPNTLKQLQLGTIDIALVYEKAQGEKAQKDGWATHYTPIFNDHFILVGPKTNPAYITQEDTPTTAFQKISHLENTTSHTLFLSRDDQSGTNIKEQKLWLQINQQPWVSKNTWYYKYHAFPKDALIESDKKSLYTITDRGTWLSNEKALQTLQVYTQSGEELLNPCFALLGTAPSKNTLDFLTYLKSERAQTLITNFGKDKFNGHALFTKASQAEFKK